MDEKPVVWLGDSRATIRAFPEDVRQIAGFQLWRVQRGAERLETDAERGVGVQEFRIQTGVEHRLLYVAKFAAPEGIGAS
jgi:phage-related protein